jgi:hypothetical protein
VGEAGFDPVIFKLISVINTGGEGHYVRARLSFSDRARGLCPRYNIVIRALALMAAMNGRRLPIRKRFIEGRARANTTPFWAPVSPFAVRTNAATPARLRASISVSR